MDKDDITFCLKLRDKQLFKLSGFSATIINSLIMLCIAYSIVSFVAAVINLVV